MASQKPRRKAAGNSSSQPNKEDPERQLDLAFASWISSDLGRQCMTYLRATVNSALPANHSTRGPIDPNQLLHREGSRWLLALMETRAERGRKNG